MILFGVAVSLLVNKGRKGPSIGPIFGVSALLFCLSTVHFAINFNNVYTSTVSEFPSSYGRMDLK